LRAPAALASFGGMPCTSGDRRAREAAAAQVDAPIGAAGEATRARGARRAAAASLVALALAAAGAAPAAAAPAFAPVETLSTGRASEGVAVGDATGDGVADVVTADGFDGALTLLRGTGGGAFAAPAEIALPGAPLVPRIADLDGDGDPDLAVANAGRSTVTLLLGDGSGGFAAPADLPALPGTPFSLEVADLDGDGALDLVAGQWFQGVAVYRGDGDGGFAPPVSHPLPGTVYGLAIADLDGDGRLDVAATTASAQQLGVLRGMPGGTLAAAVTTAVGGTPWGLAATDLDGDGRADLVTANANADVVSLLRNGGGGSFPGVTTTAATGTRPWAVVATDLDGDGDADVATGDAGAGTATVLEGDGGGAFPASSTVPLGVAPPPTPAFGGPGSLVAADADGDRLPDLVAASYDGTVSIARNAGEPSATVAPAALSFGEHAVGTAPAPLTATIANDGTERLVLDAAAIGGPGSGDYALDADACSGRTLPIGGQCTVAVRFTPGAPGARDAVLDLGGNDGAGPVRVALTGSAPQPADPPGGGDPPRGGDEPPVARPPAGEPPRANVAPTANAVVTRLRGGAGRYALDGRASVDPDGRIVSWRWRLSGRTIATKARATVRLAPRSAPYRLTLTVVDDRGASATTTVTVRAPQPPEVRVTIPARIGFAADSSVLSSRAVRLLADLRERVGGARRLVVVGHSDARGPAGYNRWLSERRARAVARALLDGVRPRPRTIEVRGVGAARPIATNGTAAGRAANRRVEIRIVTAARIL